MDREEWDELDRHIFSGSDTPLDAADEMYELLANRIEKRVHSLGKHPFSDRYELIYVEVEIAMLYRLALYFGNTLTSPTDALLWRYHTLEYFDAESKARGDAEKMKDWRSQIEKNFDRLIAVLNEK